MRDANAVLQASVTKTATFNGAAFDTAPGSTATTGTPAAGTPRRGISVSIIYSAATNASGSNSVLFSVDVSQDASTWYQHDLVDPIALSTTAQSGELFLTVETERRYLRLTVTITGGGSTPTVTYQAGFVTTKP